MSWLRRLLGGGAPAPVSPEAAPTVTLPVEPPVFADDGDNPIHRLLDAAGLPWRASRAELLAEHGLTRHPAYDWEVIELPGRTPLVEGLMSPVWVQTFGQMSPRMPATSIFGLTWFVDDARENVRRTAAGLEAALGPARIETRYNTVHCEWRSGTATLGLTGWPPELQGDIGGQNPAHDADPRMVNASHLQIETGLRPALSPRETAWLAGFERLAALPLDRDAAPETLLTTAAPESELEFVRAPPADLNRLFGAVGRSADGEALIFCGRQLYVVPVADIVRFHVERILPAKGGGGSHLTVECRSPGADDARLAMASAAGADDLTPLAQMLGEAFGKPAKLGEYFHDC